MNEPLRHFYEKYNCDTQQIKKIVTGERFSAVVLNNGNIGVCANAKHKITISKNELSNPDLNNFDHRVILTAYFNALFNYDIEYNCGNCILEKIKKGGYKKIVMIGYFETLVRKFTEEKIGLAVFDLFEENDMIQPMEKQPEFIEQADAVIMTSTTITNFTFLEILNKVKSDCDVFMLGPSSIMHKDMMDYKNIKKIFGSVFETNSNDVLNMVADGYAPKDFLKYGKKVCITK